MVTPELPGIIRVNLSSGINAEVSQCQSQEEGRKGSGGKTCFQESKKQIETNLQALSLVYSRIVISTLRLRLLPASVLLSAAGLAPPHPL